MGKQIVNRLAEARYPLRSICCRITGSYRLSIDQKSDPISTTIRATPEALYQAFTDPRALEKWQAPGDMIATVHRFDLQIGGGYEMTLTYPLADAGSGKTTASEDRFTTPLRGSR
jgi:hypothetical protein